ncbi:MAG: ester cyclase [Acidimicrobiia bacterium]|nr:ester cyclase [Acidimicrobiia bacterium]
MTSNAERAAILIQSIRASIERDSGVVKDLYTDDVSGWTPLFGISSVAELAVEYEDRGQAFSNTQIAVEPLDAAGDRVCVEWSATLTHSGRLVICTDDPMIEPTGAQLTLHGVTIAEFDGARISMFRQYYDERELLNQLELFSVD